MLHSLINKSPSNTFYAAGTKVRRRFVNFCQCNKRSELIFYILMRTLLIHSFLSNQKVACMGLLRLGRS